MRPLTRSFAVGVPAAAALATGLLLAPSAAAAGIGDLAGYQLTVGSHTSVTASWAVPVVSCQSANDYLALWIGLDGIATPTLEQAGVEVDCAGGSVEYSAFTELYPAAPIYLNNPVSAGDQLTGTVSHSGSTYSLTLTDTTTAWTHTVTGTSTGTGATAEVMAECGGGVCPGYSSLNFTGAEVDAAPLGDADPTAVSGAPGTPSPLTDGGTAFSITPGICGPVCPGRG